jgi:pimeloyl-ACP methyl ester carboxylesterase
MKNKIQHFRITVDMGTSLHAYIAQPTSDIQRQTVFIFSHGFHANGVESNRSFFDFSNSLIERGYSTVLFDYRGNGYSDLAFEDMTFDTLLKDLNIVTDFTKKIFPSFKLAFWGVSLGSALISYNASQRFDISLLILWSLSSELYQRYSKRFGSDIQKNGFTYISQGFKIKLAFLESLRNRNIYDAIKDSKIPTLLVHGNADSTAPIELSRTAHTLAPDNTTLYEIEGGNHGFDQNTYQREEALKVTLEWIEKYAK